MNLQALRQDIEDWALALNFDGIGIARIETSEAMRHVDRWIEQGFHGEMHYMAQNRGLRADPSQLVGGALTVISVRIDYLPFPLARAFERLERPELAAVSIYALGRDYHKLIRKRLGQLARQIESVVGPFGYRVFADSAPVLEKNYAERAGLGWIGKHTNLINRHAGSLFFLGEIVTDLPLPLDEPVTAHCGSCTACLVACPTAAIVAPYRLDARRCIAYLTIEHEGPIAEEFRSLIGNRVFGCDDCQLVCPWNRYARVTREIAFLPRQGLEEAELLTLFSWTESDFLHRLEGSPIRRIGYLRWLRNLAIGLGNAPFSPRAVGALRARLNHSSGMLQEHVQWALKRQLEKAAEGSPAPKTPIRVSSAPAGEVSLGTISPLGAP